MKKALFFAFLALCLIPLTSHAFAQGTQAQASLPSMFNPANIHTNTYSDTIYNFSIQPPAGWIPVSQGNKSDTSLAVFSNENPASEANFAIYYYQGKPIPPTILEQPDPLILDLAISKLFDTSKFVIYQQNIERFSDGFVIEAVAAQNQTKNFPVIEEFSFWMLDGRQYFLVMASSQTGFNQNAAAFERSVYTFYAGKPPSDTHIPPWVKITAKWWSEGIVDDKSFLAAIEYLVQKGIVTVPHTAGSAQPQQQIPSWLRSSAGWWAAGDISDGDFARGIQYLISNGIIRP